MNPWIQTHTGKAFDLLNPTPAQICIEDIAHALSNLCSFTGHSREFYSVAQHSCFVAEIAADMWQAEHGAPCPPPVRLAALLHDAAEAYIGDVSTPLKIALRGEGQLSEYDAIEKRIEHAIAERFGTEFAVRPSLRDTRGLIKRADLIALATEHRCLFDGPPPRDWGLALPQSWPGGFVPWLAPMARVRFLEAFAAYGGGS